MPLGRRRANEAISRLLVVVTGLDREKLDEAMTPRGAAQRRHLCDGRMASRSSLVLWRGVREEQDGRRG